MRGTRCVPARMRPGALGGCLYGCCSPGGGIARQGWAATVSRCALAGGCCSCPARAFKCLARALQADTPACFGLHGSQAQYVRAPLADGSLVKVCVCSQRRGLGHACGSAATPASRNVQYISKDTAHRAALEAGLRFDLPQRANMPSPEHVRLIACSHISSVHPPPTTAQHFCHADCWKVLGDKEGCCPGVLLGDMPPMPTACFSPGGIPPSPPLPSLSRLPRSCQGASLMMRGCCLETSCPQPFFVQSRGPSQRVTLWWWWAAAQWGCWLHWRRSTTAQERCIHRDP